MRFIASELSHRRRMFAGIALAIVLSVSFAFAVQHQLSVQASPYNASTVVATAGDDVEVSTPAGMVSISIPATFGGSVTVAPSPDGSITFTASQGAAAAGKSITVCLGSICKTITFDATGKASVKVIATGISTS